MTSRMRRTEVESDGNERSGVAHYTTITCIADRTGRKCFSVWRLGRCLGPVWKGSRRGAVIPFFFLHLAGSHDIAQAFYRLFLVSQTMTMQIP